MLGGFLCGPFSLFKHFRFESESETPTIAMPQFVLIKLTSKIIIINILPNAPS